MIKFENLVKQYNDLDLKYYSEDASNSELEKLEDELMDNVKEYIKTKYPEIFKLAVSYTDWYDVLDISYNNELYFIKDILTMCYVEKEDLFNINYNKLLEEYVNSRK